MHKINKSPSQTLQYAKLGTANIAENTNYLVKFSGFYFAGTSTSLSGKFLMSRDGVNWTKLTDGKTFAYHKDDEKLIIGIGNDIKLVVMTENEDYETSFDLVKINRNNFSGSPTAINIDGNSNIFVGTSDGKIYTAHLPEYASLLNGDITFEQKQLNLDDPG